MADNAEASADFHDGLDYDLEEEFDDSLNDSLDDDLEHDFLSFER